MPRFIKPLPDQIEQWIHNHFPDAKHRRGGHEMIMSNPFVDDDQFKFNISLDKAVVHDWRPHYQQWDGSFLNFVAVYKNTSFYDAIQEVCGSNKPLTYIELRDKIDPNAEEKDEVDFDIQLPKCALFDLDTESLAQTIALSYLNKRGITEDAAQRYWLHYTAVDIVFPYIEYGVLVYWQTREIQNKRFQFPTLPADACGKSCYLYGFDQVDPHSTLTVTEAIFDAHTLGEGCVATGGAGLSAKQVRKIRALSPRKIVLAPDNDGAGIKSILNDYALLSPYFDNIHYCIPPQGPKDHLEYPWKDWNQFGQCASWDKPRNYVMSNSRKLSTIEILKLRKYLHALR